MEIENLTNRLLRVNQLLKKEISQILLREFGFAHALVTVTKVETSVDLRETKVLVSIMPVEKGERILKVLQSRIFEIQQILNKKLNMRPVPKIQFQIDNSASQAQRIEELIQKIKTEEKA